MGLDYYLQFIIWLVLGGLALTFLFARKHDNVLGHKRTRWKPLAAILLVVPFIYWCATRDRGFGDTWSYYHYFAEAPDSLSGLGSYVNSFKKDNLFYSIAALTKIIFRTNNEDIYFGLVATVQMLCLVLIYRKYSHNYWLSIFLFVTSTDYTAWMFNGMRQFLAAAITFSAAGFIFKKKYLPAILLVLLAAEFHQSAILMLPVMFIVQGDAWNKKTNLILFIALLCVVFVGEFTAFLDDAMQDTQYKNVVSDFTNSEDDGTHPLRVLVYAVPMIFAFMGRKKIRESDSQLINVCVNMSIISTGVYVVSMFTSGIFLGRLPIYMSLYNYILLPWEIRHLSKREMRVAATVCMAVFYFIFYVYSYM